MSINNAADIYLIGKPIDVLSRWQLPSIRMVLGHYHHKQRSSPSITTRHIATLVIDEVYLRWNKFGIAVREKKSSIRKFEQLHQEWKLLLKGRFRVDSPAHQTHERQFVQKLDNLFDVGRHDTALPHEQLNELMNFTYTSGNYTEINLRKLSRMITGIFKKVIILPYRFKSKL